MEYRNNSKGDKQLPNGLVIPPGFRGEVSDKDAKHPVVADWIKTKALVEAEGEEKEADPSTIKSAEANPDPDDKAGKDNKGKQAETSKAETGGKSVTGKADGTKTE